MSGPVPGMPMPPPGQMPSPEQIQAMQRQLAMDAQKAGMTVPQFIEHIKRQAYEQQRAHAEQQAQHQGHNHQHPHQSGQPQAIVPGPPNPKALAVATFLRSQNLKLRTSILNGDRKDMFRGRFSHR
jgi:translocation protein SEC62